MMKKLTIIFAAALLAACAPEAIVGEINPEQTTVSASKTGLTYQGGVASFDVKSNVYWVLSTDADWVAANPKAGFGSQRIQLEIQKNEGEARKAVLVLEAYDGTTATVEVTQGSADELVVYASTGMGTGEAESASAYRGYEWDGTGTVSIATASSGVSVGTPSKPSAGYEGATGGSAAIAVEDGYISFGPVATGSDHWFSFVCGLSSGEGSTSNAEIQISSDGEVWEPLQSCRPASAWTKVCADFWIEEEGDLFFRINLPKGWCADDMALVEGAQGQGDEIVFSAGGDDKKEIGYEYFRDDFSWIDSAYKGSDYIAFWPDASSETWWGNINATYGQEAYDALLSSGWTLGDDPLKQRTYLRIGYVKMGRAANAAGSGGSLMTPKLNIKKKRVSTLKVSFKCCNFFSTGGSFESNSSMQVRIVGPGSIDGTTAVKKEFKMTSSTAVESIWRSGTPDKNPWETKEFIVNDATEDTRIVFESVQATTANRWFLDDVLIVKTESGTVTPPDPEPLAKPVASYLKGDSGENSIAFSWSAVAGAAAYEYRFTCYYCGAQVDAHSGTTSETKVVFSELLEGTAGYLEVRALPAEGADALPSEWSAEVKGGTLSSGSTEPEPEPGLPRLATPIPVVGQVSAYGFALKWDAVENATDYDYCVKLTDGTVVASGKTWESHVHIGGLATKKGSSDHFNVTVRANNMPYNSSKQPIDSTYRSSFDSEALSVSLAPQTGTVVIDDDLDWTADTQNSVLMAATPKSWINEYTVVDGTVQLPKLAAEGTLDMHGWTTQTNQCYAQMGYFRINSSSAAGKLVSPKFASLSAPTDVTVSFDGCYFYQYFSQASDARDIKVSVIGSGSIEGAEGGVLTISLKGGCAWDDYSFTVTGADSQTQLLFQSAQASTNRWFMDNFRVVTK